MSHKSYITKIKPANTNAELKAQAIKGNLDQAQLARLADVNNLGEQADEVFKGVVTHYEFAGPNSTGILYHFHETAETASLPAALGGTEYEGYYISFSCTHDGGPTDYQGISVARIIMENNPTDSILISDTQGAITSTSFALGYRLDSVNSFTTGALVFDDTGAAIPTTSVTSFLSNEDPANPGTPLAGQRKLLVSVTAGGSNDIGFTAFIRLNFMVPKGTKVTVVGT